jgi:dTDP-4-amino-4,6-dideoxygalactose transaminase
MSDRIYLSPPDVGEAEIDAVVAAMRSGWIAPVGPDLTAFEAELAERAGRRHGVGLSSGTAGLHLALLEAGVEPGDHVLVSTLTFAASANAVAYTGAIPVFVDSEAETWNMSPDLLAEAIGSLPVPPKAAVVVDLYGQCAAYDRIVPLLDAHGVALIEDAAEAIGATFKGRPAGSFGRSGVFSFNGNKIITTSGGGALVTDDEHLAGRIRHLATQAREPVAHYEHVEVGFNYRLSNLLAALGRVQLAGLDRRIERRRELRSRVTSALASVPGVAVVQDADGHLGNAWLTCITIDPAVTGTDPERVRLALEEHDIESRATWKPMHRQPAFASAPAVVDGTSDVIFECGLCLPSGSSMTDADHDRMLDVLMLALLSGAR